MSLRIRKGDKVKVLAGKDKGKTGKVLFVYPKNGRALVEGVNLAKKFVRRSQKYPSGAILDQEMPIHLSNLALLSPVSGKTTRLKTTVAEDGSKQRISAKEKAVLA
ncbi:MAG TPA: 50S ribosomal protein L24 [Candidatus Eisenbacteria bacterium]|jgi:large subunit ribosomal protein L24|nr:50S ribosomal protein L24 [Candidatus Eisenbacteria bacterium]